MLQEILSIDANKMVPMISNVPRPYFTWLHLSPGLEQPWGWCQTSLFSPILLRKTVPFSQVTQCSARDVKGRTWSPFVSALQLPVQFSFAFVIRSPHGWLTSFFPSLKTHPVFSAVCFCAALGTYLLWEWDFQGSIPLLIFPCAHQTADNFCLSLIWIWDEPVI